MQDKIFSMIMDQDEISWQTILFDLVRTEQMDPWDINISILAKRFMDRLKKLKQMDFRISGKVLLAAAILLRIKSTRLLDQDLNELDKLIASSEQTEEEFYEELEQEMERQGEAEPHQEDYKLVPRTPQPRKRKVSVYDLVGALNKALEVQKRRPPRETAPAPEVKPPERVREMTVIIQEVYDQIKDFYLNKKDQKLTFSQLIPSESKEDKAFTFVPLLHLNHQRKINLDQYQHFGEIEITLFKKGTLTNLNSGKQ